MIIAPTFFIPVRLQSTFPKWKSKSICCGAICNAGSMQSNPNSAPSVAKEKPQKHLNLLDLEMSNSEGLYDTFGGRLGQGGLVFHQNLSIKSYDLGPDGKVSMECLMKYLQETSIEHVKRAGLCASGFASTQEMRKRDLVWVFRKLHLLLHNYPSWGDVIQVDSCCGAQGNEGVIRNGIFQDCRTRHILIRATGFVVLMNMQTRNLCKLNAEIKYELQPILMDFDPFIDIYNTKLPGLDIHDATNNYVQTGLASFPDPILESHELSSMTMDFRRECRRDDVLQSLTEVMPHSALDEGIMELHHLLRLQSGSEILRANTKWRPKIHFVNPAVDMRVDDS